MNLIPMGQPTGGTMTVDQISPSRKGCWLTDSRCVEVFSGTLMKGRGGGISSPNDHRLKDFLPGASMCENLPRTICFGHAELKRSVLRLCLLRRHHLPIFGGQDKQYCRQSSRQECQDLLPIGRLVTKSRKRLHDRGRDGEDHGNSQSWPPYRRRPALRR